MYIAVNNNNTQPAMQSICYLDNIGYIAAYYQLTAGPLRA